MSIALKRPFSDGTTAIDMTRFVIPEGGDHEARQAPGSPRAETLTKMEHALK